MSWNTYRRSGEVIAERLATDLEWRTEGSDTLQGKVGDWKVHSPDNPADVWTIVDSEVHASYRHVGADVYRRTGTVQARPAEPGESVASAEGDVTAREGDWVVCRASGYCWVVPADRFRANYEPDAWTVL